MLEPRTQATDGSDQRHGTVAILDRSLMDDASDEQAAGIGEDVTLAALDVLGPVKATRAAAFSGLDALAGDDPRAGRSLAALALTGRHQQRMIDRYPGAAVAPQIEVALDRRGWRKVLRQQAPLAAGYSDVED